MKALKVFILGLLYGWFAKVAIDRIYRDKEVEDIRNENANLREYIRSLEIRLQSKPVESKSATRTTKQTEPIQTGTGKDDLKAIKGIGPAIEKKLNDAGIQTFRGLAQLSIGELENILGSTKRLVKDEAGLIAQAEKLAGQR